MDPFSTLFRQKATIRMNTPIIFLVNSYLIILPTTMKSRFIFLLLLLIPFVQGMALDSLQLQKRSDRGYEFELNNQMDSAIQIYNEVALKAQVAQLPILQGRNIRYQGMIYHQLGKMELALEKFNTAAQLFEAHGGELDYGKVITDIGNVYNIQGNFEEAISWYLKGIEIYTRRQDPRALSILNSNIGRLFFEMNNYDEALKYHQIAHDLANSIQDTSRIITSLINLGSVYDKEITLDTAKLMYQKALRLLEQNPSEQHLAYLYNNLGSIYQKQDSLDLAISFTEKAVESSFSKPDQIGFQLSLATLILQRGDDKKGEQLLQNGLREAEELGLKTYKRYALLDLSKLYASKGRTLQAYSYLEQAYAINDTILNKQVEDRITQLEFKFKTEQQEKENQQLRAENAENALQLAKSRSTSQIRLLGILLLGVVLIGGIITFWLFRKNARNKQQILEQDAILKDQKLTQMKKEQKLMTMQAMLAGEETERTRLAKDLHDGLGSLLSTVRLSLPSESKSGQLVDNAHAELRRIAHNLMPQALAKFGFLAAVEDLCEEVNHSKQLHISFQHFGELKDISSNLALSIYRIIQELVNNIIKHADASQALVQIIHRDNTLFITVEDNGKGIVQKEGEKPGIGLQNIQSRVDYLNGSWEMESEPNVGTTVSIQVDLVENKEGEATP